LLPVAILHDAYHNSKKLGYISIIGTTPPTDDFGIIINLHFVLPLSILGGWVSDGKMERWRGGEMSMGRVVVPQNSLLAAV